MFADNKLHPPHMWQEINTITSQHVASHFCESQSFTPRWTWAGPSWCWSALWTTCPSCSTSCTGSPGTGWTWSSRGWSWSSSWSAQACPWCLPMGCSTPCRTSSHGWQRGGPGFPENRITIISRWLNQHHGCLSNEEEAKKSNEEPGGSVSTSRPPRRAASLSNSTGCAATWSSSWAKSCGPSLRLRTSWM